METKKSNLHPNFEWLNSLIPSSTKETKKGTTMLSNRNPGAPGETTQTVDNQVFKLINDVSEATCTIIEAYEWMIQEYGPIPNHHDDWESHHSIMDTMRSSIQRLTDSPGWGNDDHRVNGVQP